MTVVVSGARVHGIKPSPMIGVMEVGSDLYISIFSRCLNTLIFFCSFNICIVKWIGDTGGVRQSALSRHRDRVSAPSSELRAVSGPEY